MTAVARNRRELARARTRHPTARRVPDGRGPRAASLRSSALYRLLLVSALGLS
ncbi:MAG: hypothetical protein HKN26_00310, partial [Acidimicrobiales bacterium]|nr:hypothetical protein [Acidimicrobiales bacterium]